MKLKRLTLSPVKTLNGTCVEPNIGIRFMLSSESVTIDLFVLAVE